MAVIASASGDLHASPKGSPVPARALDAALHHLVERPDGPPGAIVLVQRGDRRTVYRAGVADVATGGADAPRPAHAHRKHVEGYGAIALSLVDQGVLALDETVGGLLPWAPSDWKRVTLAQALHHTSGIPDFSADSRLPHLPSRASARTLAPEEAPQLRQGSRSPVRTGLLLPILELRQHRGGPDGEDGHGPSVPAGARRPGAPSAGPARDFAPAGHRVPHPVMHGYDREDDGTPEDVTGLVAAGYAWARVASCRPWRIRTGSSAATSAAASSATKPSVPSSISSMGIPNPPDRVATKRASRSFATERGAAACSVTRATRPATRSSSRPRAPGGARWSSRSTGRPRPSGSAALQGAAQRVPARRSRRAPRLGAMAAPALSGGAPRSAGGRSARSLLRWAGSRCPRNPPRARSAPSSRGASRSPCRQSLGAPSRRAGTRGC